MNKMEIRGFAVDFHKASGETEEPGVLSTRRPRMPAGITQPRKKRSYYGKPLPQPAFGEFDKQFTERTLNALLREEEDETATEIEDALIDAIDARRRERRVQVARLPEPRRHGRAKLVRVA